MLSGLGNFFLILTISGKREYNTMGCTFQILIWILANLFQHFTNWYYLFQSSLQELFSHSTFTFIPFEGLKSRLRLKNSDSTLEMFLKVFDVLFDIHGSPNWPKYKKKNAQARHHNFLKRRVYLILMRINHCFDRFSFLIVVEAFFFIVRI